MKEKQFTTKDIQVGKIYLRHDYPGAKWIGAGKRKAFSSKAIRKSGWS